MSTSGEEIVVNGFMPHGYCFLWNPYMVALHVISDALIGFAYFSIPLVLVYFIRRRTDVPFSWLFGMFGVFIVACGLTHFMAIVTIWEPLYWLDGAIKAVTAIASVGTAIVLYPIIPKALSLRSPAELERLNAELEALLHEKDQLFRAYEREHNVATTLQRALLPQELPRIGGLELTTAYRPASGSAEVGGDWYDAFAVSERCVAISCGDVAGHGLRAATTMGSVRQMVRLAARELDDPAGVLERVNRAVCLETENGLVAAFYGVLDLDTGSFRYALAGHPPPVVATANAETRFLETGGPVLGVDSETAFETEETALEAGSLLVVYTDGMIEAGRDVIAGCEDLVRAVDLEMENPTENAADAIQARVFSAVSPRDDAAVLAVRIHSLGIAPFELHRRHWDVDASDLASGRRLRLAIMEFLGEYGSAESDYVSAEMIVGELIGNVAKHTPGHASVAVEWRNGAAHLQVDDRGSPFAPARTADWDFTGESGRGMLIVSALGRDLQIEHRTTGNRVSVVLPILLA